MRLCDRDIEAWLDNGKLVISPRPPIERTGLLEQIAATVRVIEAAPGHVVVIPRGVRFRVEVDGEVTDERLAEIRDAAEKLLANTVIESFDVRVEQ